MIREELVSGAYCWYLFRKYIMINAPQNIKDLNVNRNGLLFASHLSLVTII